MSLFRQNFAKKYFSPSAVNEGYLAIDPDVRKMIVFAPHNILSDPPFTRLDLISCRNMLIYFSIEAQQNILGGFAFGLQQKGFLFLGSSETVGAQREAFEFVNAKNRVFRRTSVKQFDKRLAQPLDKSLKKSSRLGISRRTVKYREMALLPAYAALLAEYAPASLLISSERELLHSFGDVRGYLRPPEGVAHFDASEMVDKALKSPIIAGLERCVRDKEAISFTKIELKEFPEPGIWVDIEVKPLPFAPDSDPEHFLVIIDKSPYQNEVKSNTPKNVVIASRLDDEHIEKLETELHRTREVLQSTIEEIETTNEELQSSNEELMSSNEELQSTNEELSSVNEELYSVNAEYHSQNDELTQLNNNFDLLLQSTEIGVIFLDKDLHINRFTTLAQQIFRLSEADLGRSLSTFRSPFEGLDPVTLVEQAFNRKAVVEAEATDADGTAWLIRTVSHSNRQGGVLTIINIGVLRDAEAEARRTNAMLALLQEMTPTFYFEVNMKSHMVIQQLGLLKYTGREAPTMNYPLGLDYIHEEDREIVKVFDVSTDKNEEAETRARTWNNDTKAYRYIHYKGRYMGDDIWRITGTDIDDYMRAQIALKEREAVLEGVLRASPSLVSFVSAEERYVYVNHAYEEQWGQTSENIIGMSVEEFLPPSIYETAKPKIDAALAGERQTFLVDSLRDNGEPQKLSVVYEPVLNGKGDVRGFATDVLDVTEIFTNASALTGIQKYLIEAMNRSKNTVFIIDCKSLVIEYANPHALRLLKLSNELAIPKNVKVTRLTPTWGDDTWREFLTQTDDAGRLYREDVNAFFEDDHASIVDLIGTIIIEDGEEKALIQTHNALRHRATIDALRQRTQDLARSNRDLEQFASIVAHDLSAPLRHITQFSEIIEAELPEDVPDDIGEYLQLINSSTEKMSDMVSGLLNYAQIGLTVPQFEDVDLNACVQSVLSLLSAPIQETGATIKYDALGTVFGNNVLLTRVLQNLLSNSLKYAKEGTPPEIQIATEQHNNSVVISLTDNGIGIPKKHEDKIFMLFQRLHGEEEYEGLGLGLATCLRIVEIHKGTIKLDTDFSDGTRFIITLPAE